MPKLKVFYDARQTSPVEVASPSATKPALLIQRWLENHSEAIDLVSFEPVKTEDFYLAHDAKHVDDILACRKLNGFKDKHPEVAATFPWTTGSFVAAAFHAWKNRTFTCSPTSGFHHAERASSMGFCTFNGLMVAAIKLLHAGVEKVGIVDCDAHYGNGTDDIIEKKKLSNYIRHYTFGAEDNHNPDWKGDERADNWLLRLPEILAPFQDCQVILYQAGADAHADDPLGGGLTTEQMAKRDVIVFSTFRKYGIPVAWNLAGGYQYPIEKVLQLHDNTLQACLDNFLDG